MAAREDCPIHAVLSSYKGFGVPLFLPKVCQIYRFCYESDRSVDEEEETKALPYCCAILRSMVLAARTYVLSEDALRFCACLCPISS